jgi:hypothetical protein
MLWARLYFYHQQQDSSSLFSILSTFFIEISVVSLEHGMLFLRSQIVGIYSLFDFVLQIDLPSVTPSKVTRLIPSFKNLYISDSGTFHHYFPQGATVGPLLLFPSNY